MKNHTNDSVEKLNISLINLVSKTNLPLALYYLKTYTESKLENKVNINIIDPEDYSDHDNIIEQIKESNSKIIGFSCYIWNFLNVIELCKKIKKADENIKIILGGPEIGVKPQEIIKKYEFIDIVVAGEGEVTFYEIINLIIENQLSTESLKSINGIAFKTGNEIYQTEKRNLLKNLDEIPSPYTNGLVDFSTNKKTILYETYRGCPFECTFCWYPKDYGRLLHSFSLERIEEDIKYILKNGAKQLFLMDPTFNIPRKRAKKILKMIAKYNQSKDLYVTTELRVDHLDKETIELLPKVNLLAVEAGIQSTKPLTLDLIKRKQSFRKYQENIYLLKLNKIALICQLIYGLPGETLEDYKRSLNHCIINMNADGVLLMKLQLLPGTKMYEDAEELGLDFQDIQPRFVEQTKDMTAQDLDEAHLLASVAMRAMSYHSLFRYLVRFLSYYSDIYAYDFIKDLTLHLGNNNIVEGRDKFLSIIKKWTFFCNETYLMNIHEIFKAFKFDLFKYLQDILDNEDLIDLSKDLIYFGFYSTRRNLTRFKSLSITKNEEVYYPLKSIVIHEFNFDLIKLFNDNIIIDMEYKDTPKLPAKKKTNIIFYLDPEAHYYYNYNIGPSHRVIKYKVIDYHQKDSILKNDFISLKQLEAI